MSLLTVRRCQTLKISTTIAFWIKRWNNDVCLRASLRRSDVWKPLAGFPTVLQGVAAGHNDTQHNGSDLYVTYTPEWTETINLLIN